MPQPGVPESVGPSPLHRLIQGVLGSSPLTSPSALSFQPAQFLLAGRSRPELQAWAGPQGTARLCAPNHRPPSFLPEQCLPQAWPTPTDHRANQGRQGGQQPLQGRSLREQLVHSRPLSPSQCQLDKGHLEALETFQGLTEKRSLLRPRAPMF